MWNIQFGTLHGIFGNQTPQFMKQKSTKKLKKISIEIQFRENLDFGLVLNNIKQMVAEGVEFDEFTIDSANANFKFEFLEKSEYIERQIDGIWFQVIKSSM